MKSIKKGDRKRWMAKKGRERKEGNDQRNEDLVWMKKSKRKTIKNIVRREYVEST